MKYFLILLAVWCNSSLAQTHDPNDAVVVMSDLENFWTAMEEAGEDIDPKALDKFYLKPGSKGVKDFTKNRIVSAEHLASVIKKHRNYYLSLKGSTDKIELMESQIMDSFFELRNVYPKAVFPPVYFVVGAMNSGGRTGRGGLIIGVDMYGLTDQTDLSEFNDWEKAVLKPIEEIPHIVAHELIHVQQRDDGGTLLKACLKEGSADFLAELISDGRINDHVHDFANPREKELWLEFKGRMDKKDRDGWLYSSTPGRPNDLGYWMGYQITKAYYDRAEDKALAIKEIIEMKDAKRFLEKSGYAKRFE